MNNKKIFFIIIILLMAGIFYYKTNKDDGILFRVSGVSDNSSEIIRKPAVAGAFYPAGKIELGDMVDGFLNSATPPATQGKIIALVAPHAGYVYSGQVAANAYKKLIGEDVDTVIIIGASHTEAFDGISVFPKGVWRTPLGDVKVDATIAEKLIKASPRIFYKESAHREEHSLEVQLPFLQKVLKNFKIVPILFGNISRDDYKILAKAISETIKGKNVLLVASSDLSHYPSYKDAKAADAKTTEGILSNDCDTFEKNIEVLEKKNVPNAVTFACGSDAIKTIMLVAKDLGASEVALLNSANSGDVSGDKARVVGYAAIGFFGEQRGNLLTEDEQKKLLEIARKSVESYVVSGKIPGLSASEEKLNDKIGAFVTLKKDGKLRGCIGRFSPTDIPLYKVVSEMAIAAATQDGRFNPVTKDELKDLRYEISVLSQNEKINDWKDIELGRHGVIVRSDSRSGVFLPQVAQDTGWDLDKFLSELCSQKAGLSPNCWKDGSAELYVFTAQVFNED